MEKKEFKTELGKYFIDISKLILGGVVLATVIKVENVNRILILLSGILATAGFAILGFVILKNKK